MMPDSSFLYLSDLAGSDIESSVYLSRIHRNDLTPEVFGHFYRESCFATGSWTVDDHELGFLSWSREPSIDCFTIFLEHGFVFLSLIYTGRYPRQMRG